jgi:hypothetical protein
LNGVNKGRFYRAPKADRKAFSIPCRELESFALDAGRLFDKDFRGAAGLRRHEDQLCLSAV